MRQRKFRTRADTVRLVKTAGNRMLLRDAIPALAVAVQRLRDNRNTLALCINQMCNELILMQPTDRKTHLCEQTPVI